MPELAQKGFRDWFYQHWGRENCVISARARHAEYPPYQQRLSIKAAWNGTEDYFIDGRRVAAVPGRNCAMAAYTSPLWKEDRQ